MGKHITMPAADGWSLDGYRAGHGFNCDARGSYHAESANQALGRSLDSLSSMSAEDAAEAGADKK